MLHGSRTFPPSNQGISLSPALITHYIFFVFFMPSHLLKFPVCPCSSTPGMSLGMKRMRMVFSTVLAYFLHLRSKFVTL